MHTPAVFYVRPLLWEELRKHANQAEIHELKLVLGHDIIDENEGLQAELNALVDILSDFQKENDRIREAIENRPTLPEPPGRALLLDQLKILASDLHERHLPSQHDRELLGYVLSSASSEDAQQNDGTELTTPRLKDYDGANPFIDQHGVLIRPGTADRRRRPATASRPMSSRGLSSRGSITSTASAPAVLEDLDCVNIRHIDSMKTRLRDALSDEKEQLMEDIEFIQGCLEMEQDLIEEDTKKCRAVILPAPSFKDLNDFRKTLEQACQEKDKDEVNNERIAKVDTMLRRRKSIDRIEFDQPASYVPTAQRKRGSTKVHRVREISQIARDEPFLS